MHNRRPVRTSLNLKASQRMLALMLLALVVCLLAMVSSALAITPQEAATRESYKDHLKKACCGGAIEEGATEREYFEVENTGTVEWGSFPVISLAPEGWEGPERFKAEPFERGEDDPFRNPADPNGWQWGQLRVIKGITESVPAGSGSHRFAFDVTAPNTEGPYDLRFAVVVEDRQKICECNLTGWLDSKSTATEEGEFGEDLNLGFNVVKATPPTATVSVQPAEVLQGQPFTVTVNAVSTVSVKSVMTTYREKSAKEESPRAHEASPAKPVMTLEHTFIAEGSGPEGISVSAEDDAGLTVRPSAVVTVITAQQKRESEELEAQKLREIEAQDLARKQREKEKEEAQRQKEKEEKQKQIEKEAKEREQKEKEQKEKEEKEKLKPLGDFKPSFARSAGTSKFMVTEIKIRDLQAGDRVEATCQGCRGASKFRPVTAHGSSVVFRLQHLQVTVASRITFKVTRAGYLGRSQTWRFFFHPRRGVKASDICLLEGAATETACPGE